MKRNILGFILIVAVLQGAGAATITTYTSQATWLAAVGGSSILEDFNDVTLASGLNSITGANRSFPYSSVNAFTGQSVLHGVISNSTGGTGLTIAFSTPISGLGAFWDLYGPGGQGSNITLNLIDGGTSTFTDFFLSTLAGDFLGFTSGTAFTSIVLTNGTRSPGSVETFEIENMQFMAAIPEPATASLFLALPGLLLFAGWRERMRKRRSCAPRASLS